MWSRKIQVKTSIELLAFYLGEVMFQLGYKEKAAKILSKCDFENCVCYTVIYTK